jgi:hypothetical protein
MRDGDGLPQTAPDVWLTTVRLLLDCPDVDRRDRIGLHKVAGWKKLGRAEEAWLARLAAQHLGEVGEAIGPDDELSS